MSVSLPLVGILATMALVGPVFNQQGAAPPVTIIEVPFTTPPDWPADTYRSAKEGPVSTPPDSEAPVDSSIPLRSVQESGVSGSAGPAEDSGHARLIDPSQDDGSRTESRGPMEAPPADWPDGSQSPSTEPSQTPEAAPLAVGSGSWVLAVVAGAMTGLVLLLGFQTWHVVRSGDQAAKIRAPGPRSGAYFIGRFDDQRSDEVIPEQDDRVS